MTSDTAIPDPKRVAEIIRQNRDRFIHYNIAHLRELIRYLSPDKLELFHTLPFLLHVNSTLFPGYVPGTDVCYGIYGFQDSGFWKLALRHFKFREQDLIACLARKFHIQGLYLMGSSGTLAQGEHSDLDYWVLVDEAVKHGRLLKSLKHKLSLLEEWAQKTYHQQITFFVLSTEEVKNNTFQQVDEESSGTIQQTILKEEFYRTFIMIAGRLPFWTVFPTGQTEPQYRAWIQAIRDNRQSMPDTGYIDLGFPAPINPAECPGALLWQVFKARHDPVKSFIKASLITAFFFAPGAALPCDEIKKRFSDRKLDSCTVDPYSIIFELTLSYYEKTGDRSRLELLRECLFLRIHGYPLVKPVTAGSPKDELLQIYLNRWGWNADRIERLRNYSHWPEPDKLDYEIRIISRISTLYTEIQSSRAHRTTAEVRSVRNRITAVLQTRPRKVPRCSAFIKARSESGTLQLTVRYADSGNRSWVVEEKNAPGKQDYQRKLFTAAGPAHLAGWLHVNHLPFPSSRAITLSTGDHFLRPREIQRFLEQAASFFNTASAALDYNHPSPVWSHVLVAVEAPPSEGHNNFERFDIILQNTWGEMFHHQVDPKDIENNMLKCYTLSNTLQALTNDAPSRDLQYLILTPGSTDDRYARKTTLGFLRRHEEAVPDKTAEITKTEKPSVRKNNGPEKPFLDRL